MAENWRDNFPPLKVECPKCGARAGQSCHTDSITGYWSTFPHAARWKGCGVTKDQYYGGGYCG